MNTATILTREGLRPDGFRWLDDDEALPADPGAAVQVSLARWQQDREALKARSGPAGLRLDNTVDVTTVEGLASLALVELDFPGFADGRAYSQARLLRTRLGYRGALRARGAAVVRDQLAMLQRCGFDQFRLREDQDPAACLAVLEAPVLAYQPAADGIIGIRTLRRATVGS